jgi:transposase-like protein
MSPPFFWTPKRSKAAELLAEGQSAPEVAKKIGVNEKTIDRWRKDARFTKEVDRLSLMIDIACRAVRMRIAQRFVRQKTEGEKIESDRDLLDWLKYAQSETDGIKLGLTEDLLDFLSSGCLAGADSGLDEGNRLQLDDSTWQPPE